MIFAVMAFCRMRVNNAPRAMPNINIPSNSRTSDLVPMTIMYSSETAVHARCWQSCFEIRTEATLYDHAIFIRAVFLLPCRELTAQECAMRYCGCPVGA